MKEMVVDTHKATKRLVEVGLPENQAEAIVDLRYRSDIDILKTKLQNIETELKLLRLELQKNLYK